LKNRRKKDGTGYEKVYQMRPNKKRFRIFLEYCRN